MASQFFTEDQVHVINDLIEQKIGSVSASVKRNFVPLQQWANTNSISVSKLYALRQKGKLRFFRFGDKNTFLRLDEVEALMQEI